MITRTVSLDAVCERIDYGFTASADFSVKEPRLLRITDIQEGSVDWNRVPGCRITPEEEADKLLCAGDIVFARTGATPGKCFLIEHAPRAVFASYLIRLLYAHERSQGKKGGIGDSRVRSSQRDIDFAGTGVVLCLVAAATRRARARSPESYEHVRHHSMKQA